ncbi:MAG: VCBS repeat-containing protein [Planctomyces sp.]|nr:VCBS repeat-containing protein [Planctomyces sp.]
MMLPARPKSSASLAWFSGLCTWIFGGLMLSGGLIANDVIRFEEQTIDADVGKVCYAVTLSDINNDDRPDIVAVTESRVVWYENPTWTMRVMIQDQTPADNVCIAPMDIDQDGKIDFAVGAGWTKRGTLHWITRGATLDDRWSVYSIGEESWLHRARWADVLGKGRPQLVISPLNATTGSGVRLMAFEIPADPKTDRWQSIVLSEELNRMHNHWHVDFDGDGAIDTLTASQEGLKLIQRIGDMFATRHLGDGADAPDAAMRGAGEIKIGSLSGQKRFLTAVEPMHGHSLTVYTEPEDATSKWNRMVIDEGFQRGHGLWTADLNGDGSDEVIFGHSDTPGKFGVIVYSCAGDDSAKWSRHVVDEGGIATEDLVVGDVNGDGRPDIVAGGRATHNVKLYLNRIK